MKKNRKIHIAVIVLGIIFILASAFHSNLWFDETYSIALTNHNFIDIWKIGGNDVHPILYYWLLHIITLITGIFKNQTFTILAARLFSCVATIILGILGYTHVRKDFGEKTGLIFSFLVFFMTTQVLYSSEIRMYTWAMLFVFITALYAYRILKNSSTKNWVIFAIFSLASAYTHYYGLMTVGLINLILFIYLIVKIKKSTDETKKQYVSEIKHFAISAAVQIILYIPWLFCLITQLTHVAGGFWISFEFPKSLIDVFKFEFTGNLGGRVLINEIVGIGFGVLLIAYTIFRLVKECKDCKNDSNEDKKEIVKPAILAISIYLLVFLATIIISLKSPILYPRYMLVVTGLLFFYIAFAMSKEKNKFITAIICLIMLIFGVIANVKNIQMNYDSSNSKPLEYVKENSTENDIIFYSAIGNGSVYAVNFPDNKQYFYNKEFWGIDEAYKAYAPQMGICYSYDILADFTGTIWLIDTEDYSLYNDFPKEYIKNVVEIKEFDTAYQDNKFRIIKIEK